MDLADLKTKSEGELESLLKEYEIKLGQLSFERTRKTLKKSSEIKKAKKIIAQIRTLLWNTK